MLFPIIVANNIQPYIDALILAKLAPSEAVGWYGAAKSIIGTISAPALIVGLAMYPRLSQVAVNIESIKAEAQASVRPFLWIGALAATGSFLFADDAIAIIYGHGQFAASGLILKVYAPAFFLLSINVLLGYILLARSQVISLTVVKGASVLVSTVLGLVLIPIFQQHTGNGGIGVVAAFVASELVVFGGLIFLLWRERIRFRMATDMARTLGAAGLTLLLFWWMPPLPFLVGVPVCVLAFLLISICLGLVRRKDIRFCQALLRKGAPTTL
jgi:O-antigen/teichoic acid export membrane protein